MLYVTRKEQFNAAHKLGNPAWSQEKNEAVFGKCANENWHGHNYDLYVTVKGKPNPETSFVIDLKLLSKLIKEEITDKVDHKNFNIDVDFMQGVMTSTESIVLKFWEILAPKIKELCDGELHCIKLYETERNSVEYYGGFHK